MLECFLNITFDTGMKKLQQCYALCLAKMVDGRFTVLWDIRGKIKPGDTLPYSWKDSYKVAVGLG